MGHFQKDEAGLTGQFYPHIGTLYPNANGRHIPQDRFVGEPGDYYNTDVGSGTLLFEHAFNSAFKIRHSSRYTDIHNEYDSTYAAWTYLDADEEELNRYRYVAITDTRTFNQDTNLEAKFATGILSHRVLGGVDYTHFDATTGSNFAFDHQNFNVYDPAYGQGMWEGIDCAGTYYDGVNSSLDDLEVCTYSDQSVNQTGLYLQDQIRLENWIAVLGMRKDWITNKADGSDTQKDDAVSYRAGLMYEFGFGLTPYVSYSESFAPVVATGGPFAPKEGRMYEVGFKYQPIGSNFAINGAVYDIQENGRLAPDPFNPNQNVQIGEVEIKGFELEIVGQVTRNLKVAGGYSYTEAQYGDGELTYDSLSAGYVAVGGNQLESVPKHLASLWGVWEFDQPELKGWSVGAGVRYIGTSWDSTNAIKTPDVTLFDALVAYEEEDWRWSINAKNLEDKEYLSTCLNRGDCFIGTARTIMTGLTYKF